MNTWVYGKDGWYVAMNGWRDSYAEHLRSLGYQVVQSITKPDVAVEAVSGR